MDLLKVPASKAHTGTVIFIHGLGQSNSMWKTTLIEYLASKLPHIEWILPQASEKPVLMNDGQLRPSWFDISSLPPSEDEYDEQAISESVAIIDNLIQVQLAAGIDSRKIVLIGFSQGAALSLMLALIKSYKLGGVASLSGWIPHRARDQMRTAAADFPIFWGHGTADDEIPLEYAKESISFLQSMHDTASIPLQLKIYAGLDHSIHGNEVDDLFIWIEEVIA